MGAERIEKTAVITGAAQGIGRRVAEEFGEAGYRWALADLREPTETVKGLKGNGVDVMTLVGDISDEATVERISKDVLKRWGRVDVLVNNAGISFIENAERICAADFRRVLEVNLVAPFLLAKAFGVGMLAQKSGSIVNVASIAGLVGVADRAAYNASKHGLVGLTRTLAAEWGGRGVR